MLSSRHGRRRRRKAALLRLLAMLLVVGCDDPVSNADTDASSAAPRVKERTVSIEFLHTGERTLQTDDTGKVTYPKMKPIGGVEICIIKRRNAFDSFKPFAAVQRPICDTNAVDKLVRLKGVPANSDLLITYAKAGYQPVLTTFRTDEYNVALQDWADQIDAATYYIPMLRIGADLPDDSAGPAQATGGRVAIWVYSTGEYAVGPGQPVFNVDDDSGVGQAEGVNVKIAQADGAEVMELKTRRDRPMFVSLPEASYRFEFTHPIFELIPTGVQEQNMFGGLPTETFNTIEVPILRGFLTLALVDGYCPLPVGPNQRIADLATCAVSDAADAGAR
jgi:hypothetical protein